MALDYKTNNYIYKIKIQAEIGAERQIVWQIVLYNIFRYMVETSQILNS